MYHKYNKSSNFTVKLEEKPDRKIWKAFESSILCVSISIFQSRKPSLITLVDTEYFLFHTFFKLLFKTGVENFL